GNAGNRRAFVVTDSGEQGAGGNKKNTFPPAGDNLRKESGGENHGRAAAAASSGMGILCPAVVNHDPAVFVDAADINSLLLKKVQKYFLPDHSQISRYHCVVISGGTSEVGEVPKDGIACGRRHAAAHIQRIAKTEIYDFPCGNACDNRVSVLAMKGRTVPFRDSGTDNACAAAGHCPGGGERALVSVAQRITE